MHTSRLSRPTVRGGTMALRACLCQQANCTLIARTGLWVAVDRTAPPMLSSVSCAFSPERVTRIELALSAWESDRSGPLTALTSASDAPQVTVLDPAAPRLMAREWPEARSRWAMIGTPHSRGPVPTPTSSAHWQWRSRPDRARTLGATDRQTHGGAVLQTSGANAVTCADVEMGKHSGTHWA